VRQSARSYGFDGPFNRALRGSGLDSASLSVKRAKRVSVAMIDIAGAVAVTITACRNHPAPRPTQIQLPNIVRRARRITQVRPRFVDAAPREEEKR